MATRRRRSVPRRKIMMAVRRNMMPIGRNVVPMRRNVMPVGRNMMPVQRNMMPIRETYDHPCYHSQSLKSGGTHHHRPYLKHHHCLPQSVPSNARSQPCGPLVGREGRRVVLQLHLHVAQVEPRRILLRDGTETAMSSPNRIESNRIGSNRIGSNRIESDRIASVFLPRGLSR